MLSTSWVHCYYWSLLFLLVLKTEANNGWSISWAEWDFCESRSSWCAGAELVGNFLALLCVGWLIIYYVWSSLCCYYFLKCFLVVMAMGFSAAEARLGLRVSGNNVTRALAHIIEQREVSSFFSSWRFVCCFFCMCLAYIHINMHYWVLDFLTDTVSHLLFVRYTGTMYMSVFNCSLAKLMFNSV